MPEDKRDDPAFLYFPTQLSLVDGTVDLPVRGAMDRGRDR